MEQTSKISFEDTAIAFEYKSDKALRKANFIFSLVNHPWISALATGAVKFALKAGLDLSGCVCSVFLRNVDDTMIALLDNGLTRDAEKYSPLHHNFHNVIDSALDTLA